MSVWVPGLLEVGTTSVSVSVLGVEYGGPGRWDGQDTRLACRPPPSPKSLWATTPGGGIIISTTHSLTARDCGRCRSDTDPVSIHLFYLI